MSKTFNIDMFDGHLIFDIDGMKVLVDTGCPVSISRQNSFIFLGQEYRCHTSYGGKDIDGISQLMNYDIDVFMGMDILENYYILTDYRHRRVTFSIEPIPFEPIYSTPILRGCTGEVCVNLTIKGNVVKLALDTGAKISYIDKSLTMGESIIQKRDDFNPMIGHFQTPIFAMEATIDGKAFPVNFGVIPAVLAMPLQWMGIFGAIGFDLFNAFNVLMDFKNNMLYMS